jgi:hypothetical protein
MMGRNQEYKYCFRLPSSILTERYFTNKLFFLRPAKNIGFFKKANLKESSGLFCFNVHTQNSHSPIYGGLKKRNPHIYGCFAFIGIHLFCLICNPKISYFFQIADSGREDSSLCVSQGFTLINRRIGLINR